MSRDRGSAALELVLLTPVFIALLLFVTAGGRFAEARSDVDAAARDAARAASIERTRSAARSAAEASARRRLEDEHVICQELRVMVDDRDFRPGGTVGATVSCRIGLDDLTGIGLPSSTSVTATFTQPLDTFRGAGG